MAFAEFWMRKSYRLLDRLFQQTEALALQEQKKLSSVIVRKSILVF